MYMFSPSLSLTPGLPECLGLLLSANDLHHGEELLVALVSLLLLQHQHEVVLKAALHHHPVHRPGKVDVRRQEHNVLPVKHGDRLVSCLKVVQHCFKRTVPLA